MLLAKPDILAAMHEGRLRFDPEVNSDRVKQVSIDLRLGRRFTRFKEPPKYIASIRIDPSIYDSLDIWEHMEQDSYVLLPGKFVLAQTLETASLPNDLAGFVEGEAAMRASESASM